MEPNPEDQKKLPSTLEQPTPPISQPPSTSTASPTPPISQPPPPTPTASTPSINKFNQLKLLGWILALLAGIFILLVIVAIASNFTRSGKTPTSPPTILPTPQVQTPAPPIPESRFNLSP